MGFLFGLPKRGEGTRNGGFKWTSHEGKMDTTFFFPWPENIEEIFD